LSALAFFASLAIDLSVTATQLIRFCTKKTICHGMAFSGLFSTFYNDSQTFYRHLDIFSNKFHDIYEHSGY
jgi:hypothetical protein